MDIGEPKREIIIEPIEEPKWIEEPAPAPARPVEKPAETPEKVPVPA